MVSGLPEGVEGALRQLGALYGAGSPAAGQASTMMRDVAATLRGEHRSIEAHATARGGHATHADTHGDDDDRVHKTVTRTGGGTVAGRSVLADQLADFQERVKAVAAVAGTRFSSTALLGVAHAALGNATRQVNADVDASRRHAQKIVLTAGKFPQPRARRTVSLRRSSRRHASRRRGRIIRSDGTAGGNAVEAASRWVGTPYVWGGGGSHGPSGGGFDCSGLTQYAVSQASGGHVALPRTTYEQIHSGMRVSMHDVRAGDLIFPADSFSRRGPEHVQLATSRDTVLEAPHTGANVRYSHMPRNAVVIRVL